MGDYAGDYGGQDTNFSCGYPNMSLTPEEEADIRKTLGRHATKKILIKEANVDIDIIFLVDWLNARPGIITQWSCQGDYDLNQHERSLPYVRFFCDDRKSLIEVQQLVQMTSLHLLDDEYIDFTTEIRYTSFGIITEYGIGMSECSVLSKIKDILR